MKTELTIDEVTELLQVSNRTVQRLLKNADLVPVYHRHGKKGRIRNISLSSVARYVKKRNGGDKK